MVLYQNCLFEKIENRCVTGYTPGLITDEDLSLILRTAQHWYGIHGIRSSLIISRTLWKIQSAIVLVERGYPVRESSPKMVSDGFNTVEAGPLEFHGNTLWAQFFLKIKTI